MYIYGKYICTCSCSVILQVDLFRFSKATFPFDTKSRFFCFPGQIKHNNQDVNIMMNFVKGKVYIHDSWVYNNPWTYHLIKWGLKLWIMSLCVAYQWLNESMKTNKVPFDKAAHVYTLPKLCLLKCNSKFSFSLFPFYVW